MLLLNYVPPVKRVSVPLKKHGKAVGVYQFGIRAGAILGIQPITLTESWDTQFEEDVYSRSGLLDGTVLGAGRGTFELEGLWVGRGSIKSALRQSFQHEGRTYYVRRVKSQRANRDFRKATLSGISDAGIGNAAEAVLRLGNVFAEGASSGPETDVYGVTTDVIVKRIPAPVSMNSLPSIGSAHPREFWMKLQSIGAATVRRGYAEVPLTYRGLRTSPGLELVKLDKASSEEPLPSHPRYSSIAGLDKLLDMIEAIRRGDARLGLFPGSEVPNVWLSGRALELYQKMISGKESYFAPGQTWRTVQYSSEPMILNEVVPRRNSPANAPAYSERDWLYTGAVQDQEGPSIFRTERTWLLSAPGGWDVQLYS